MSQSPNSLLLSQAFVALKQKIYCTLLYTEGAKVTVQLNYSGAALRY